MKLNSTIYFMIFFNFAFLFLICVFAEEPCFKYVKCDIRDRCGCGKKPNYKNYNKSHASSRLINAKTSERHDHPWMARVQRQSVLTNEGTNAGENKIQLAAGAIINEYSILTVGHHICINERNKKEGTTVHQVTCPHRTNTMTSDEWNQLRSSNLNQLGPNEITAMVGTNLNTPSIITPTYNPKVSAYLYDYEEPPVGNP